MSQDGSYLPDSEISKQLNPFFADVFTQDWLTLHTLDINPNISEMSPAIITAEGIGFVIDGLPVGSPPGQGGINSKILKMMKSIPSLCLCKLFDQSLLTGILLRDWKHTDVVPVFKSGDVNYLNNYRLICLTSACSKMFEHILFVDIMHFLAQVM